MNPENESRKWIVRSYYPDGVKVEKFATEAEGWAAAKRHLKNGVAVAGPSGPLDPDDLRRYVVEVGMVVDDVDALDKLFTKWRR